MVCHGPAPLSQWGRLSGIARFTKRTGELRKNNVDASLRALQETSYQKASVTGGPLYLRLGLGRLVQKVSFSKSSSSVQSG
jgi:hypothetical protein